MKEWPSTLPGQCFGDIKVKQEGGLADDAESLNPDRKRSSPEYSATLSFFLRHDQLQAFRQFYEEDLNGGCAPFTASWLTNLGYSHHFARITTPPSWTPANTFAWRLSLPLEIITGAPVEED